MVEGGPLAVGVDVGGTKLAAGLIRDDGTVVHRLRRQTPAGDADAIVDVLLEVIDELRARAPHAVAVGVGAAGLIDRAGVVRYAPNIAWTDFGLRQRLTDALGHSVVVDNDANVAAWAEHRCGAGRGAGESLVMLTTGTGVGGGLVLDGRLVRGTNGLGAEFGHLVVKEGGPRCACGNRGCLESLASGTAIGRYAQQRQEAGELRPDSVLHSDPNPTGKSVTQAGAAGDADALEILQEAGFWLGVGIASLVNALDPDIVVLGGGAMSAGDLLLDSARESAEARVIGRAYRLLPPILPSALGDEGGFIGAGLLALAESR